MGKFVRGQIVVVPFPFTDTSDVKKRPAVVIGEAEMGDFILCMITKSQPTSEDSVELTQSCFASGGLVVNPSYARPCRIFTAHVSIIEKSCGVLNQPTIDSIKAILHKLFCT